MLEQSGVLLIQGIQNDRCLRQLERSRGYSHGILENQLCTEQQAYMLAHLDRYEDEHPLISYAMFPSALCMYRV